MLSKYLRFSTDNSIKFDQEQQELIKYLSDSYNDFINCISYQNKPFLYKILSKKPPIRNLYLYGKVGRGKSTIIDIFFNHLETDRKKRLHFHNLMISIHQQLHKYRSSWCKKNLKYDFLKSITKDITKKYGLLYIDELDINDIADAMIVGRLFKELLNDGVIVIVTSNKHPDDLYKDGLQRERFLEFIDIIKKDFFVFNLNSYQDYRRTKEQSIRTTYFIEEGKDSIDKMFLEITNNTPVKTVILNINSRELVCSNAATNGPFCRFSFNELCKSFLGVSDYIALCKTFEIIFIDNIPILTPEDRNEAKRFIVLIDTLYEYKTILFCSASAAPENLYKIGDGSLEFARTISRLYEMQSIDWIRKNHS